MYVIFEQCDECRRHTENEVSQYLSPYNIVHIYDKNTLGKFEQKRKTDNITIVQHKMQGKMHQRGNNLFQFDNNYEPQ